VLVKETQLNNMHLFLGNPHVIFDI